MEVEFNLTPEDILASVRFRQGRHNARPAARWPWIVLFGLLVFMFFVGNTKRDTPAAGFIPGLGMGALAAVLLFILFKLLALRSQKQLLQDARNQWVFATRRVTLSPEELAITSWFARFYYRWEVVSDIGVTPDHVFLFLTSTDASIVPRRAFRDQQHFEEFVALARRYKEGAPTSTAITAAPPRPTTITRPPE